MSSSGSRDSEKNTSADNQEPLDETQQYDTEPKPINVWQRWQGGEDVPFHQYCNLFYRRTELEGDSTPHEWIYYTRGIARQALRITPAIIFAVSLIIGSVGLLDGGTHLNQLLQGTQFEGLVLELTLAIVGGIVLWLFLLLWILSKVKLIPRTDFLQSLIVYATLLILLVDVVYFFTQVTIALQEGNANQLEDVSFIPGSSLLLTLLIGGILVYDGMLRTENMFSRLHKKDPPIIGPLDPDSFGTENDRDTAFEEAREAYESNFLKEFRNSLDDKLVPPDVNWLPTNTSISVPTAYVFAIVFVAPFFLIRLSDAVDASDIVSAISISVLNLVEVIVFFQFLVLIKYFNRLLTEHSPYEDNRNDGFTLQYQPDHPDGYAGFRDLGRFATRVNTLLLLGGGFTAYWLYTAGLPSFPTDATSILSSKFVIWIFSFLSPLLVYIITVIVWIYFSFWQIHKTMRKGRERHIKKTIPDGQTGELPDEKRDLKQAPIWPLNIRTFVSIVIGDTLPLLSLVPLIV